MRILTMGIEITVHSQVTAVEPAVNYHSFASDDPIVRKDRRGGCDLCAQNLCMLSNRVVTNLVVLFTPKIPSKFPVVITSPPLFLIVLVNRDVFTLLYCISENFQCLLKGNHFATLIH